MDTLDNMAEITKLFQKILLERNCLFANSSSITPFLINSSDYMALCKQTNLIMEAIEVVMSNYLTNKEIQSYYPELQHLNYLFELDKFRPNNERKLNQLSRFDYIMDENCQFFLMETNSSIPGGILYPSLIKKVYRELPYFNGKLDLDKDVILNEIDDEEFLFRHMIKLYQQSKGSSDIPSIAFVNSKIDTIITDQSSFLDIGNRLGIEVFVAAVEDLEYTYESGLSFQGKRIDFVWNKIGSFISIHSDMSNSFDVYSTTNKVKLENYNQAIKDQKVIVLNSYHSNFIAENKKTLALLQDSRFSHLFTNEQLEAIHKLVPPTCTLCRNHPGFMDLLNIIISNKDDYVIKGSLETRGRAVVFGKQSSQNEWKQIVERSIDGPFMFQKFIKSKQYKIFHNLDKKYVNVNHTLAIYVVGGKTVGIYSRASENLITNIYANGIVMLSCVTKY